MLFTYSALTDVGVARSMQQDSILILPQILHDNASQTNEWHFDDINAAMFSVADGMGGGAHGEIASRLVVEGLRDYVLSHKEQLPLATYSLVNGAIYHANQNILDHLNVHPDDLSMGSTVVVGLIQDEVLSLGWVGDSRCYILTRDEKLIQLSHDHSYVQTLVDEGQITNEEAFDHPNRNIIHQSMGMASVLPSFEKIQLDDCNMILLCSDGLNSMLRDEEIREVLLQKKAVGDINRELVDKANAQGGADNISSILIQLHVEKNIEKPIALLTEADSKKIKKSFPWTLLIVGLCLTVLFAVAFNFQTKNKSERTDETLLQSVPAMIISTVDSTCIPPDSIFSSEESYYYIRLKVFSDSSQAQLFLNKIMSNAEDEKYVISRSADGLYEVCMLDFETKESAITFLKNGLHPDAVILYKK